MSVKLPTFLYYLNSSGKTIVLTRLENANTFGEAIVFSKFKGYPSNIIALKQTKLLFIKSEDIIFLCSRYQKFLEDFMRLLSNRILMLSDKVREL